jgi:hypothetical protein
MKLSDEERQLLLEPWDPDFVTKKLHAIQEEQERKAKKTKAKQITSNFVNDFCRVADQASEIVRFMLPNSPEYTVTFSLLALLFKVRPFNRQSILRFSSRLTGCDYKERQGGFSEHLHQVSVSSVAPRELLSRDLPDSCDETRCCQDLQ